jgi:hypothetical protein
MLKDKIQHQAEQRTMALLSGWSLWAMALIAGLGYGYAFSEIYVPGQAELTRLHLQEQPWLIQMVLVSFGLILVLDIILAFSLYRLTARTAPGLARLMSGLRLVYTLILGLALSQLLIVRPFSAELSLQGEALLLPFGRFLKTWSLGLIVFGVHLCALALLLKKAGGVPKLLQLLTGLAGLCYLFSNLAQQAWPEYSRYLGTADTVLALPMALGELGLASWLLFVSWRKTKVKVS